MFTDSLSNAESSIVLVGSVRSVQKNRGECVSGKHYLSLGGHIPIIKYLPGETGLPTINYAQCRRRSRVVDARCSRVMPSEERRCEISAQCRVRLIDKSFSRSNLLSSHDCCQLTARPVAALVSDVTDGPMCCVRTLKCC